MINWGKKTYRSSKIRLGPTPLEKRATYRSRILRTSSFFHSHRGRRLRSGIVINIAINVWNLSLPPSPSLCLPLPPSHSISSPLTLVTPMFWVRTGRTMTWPGVEEAVMLVISGLECRAANSRLVSVVCKFEKWNFSWNMESRVGDAYKMKSKWYSTPSQRQDDSKLLRFPHLPHDFVSLLEKFDRGVILVEIWRKQVHAGYLTADEWTTGVLLNVPLHGHISLLVKWERRVNRGG